ncbi:PucR family transcriptional regulator [Mycolicibacterium phlei]|jgi:purine catabolism regulator|uniref:PucR family transcriptional regulator n=1 Tax=Mycolicibacterium phlei TaxID=1771 RepID=UPI00025AEB5F|nr:PucR family transcriptional regulator [Mycolicibacterium phlei]EID16157.1 transcriptional regulator [Mycolicibacterium phlei RIVM601174]MBF4195059.1 transcriptional regulator [Mycolicibacterium phlei]
MLMTVADVLELPVMQAGEPLVVGGRAGLSKLVRWVHVSDLADVAELLQGGELVLTTGQALTAPDAGTYLRSLATVRVAGLVVELGTHLRQVPSELVAVADELALPLVTLARRTRFVEVTEAVHRVIVADQYEELQFVRTVHETFTALSVKRASMAEIVRTGAAMVGASMVLEDLSHRVLAYAAHGVAPSLLLDDWEPRSRLTPDAGELSWVPERWAALPVGATQPWGRLVIRVPAAHPNRTRIVAERVAQTLTLHRMMERDEFELGHQAQAGLIDDILSGRLADEAEAMARAAALGLTRRGRYVAVSLAVEVGAARDDDQLARQRRMSRIYDAVTHGLELSRGTGLLSRDRDDQIGMVIAVAPGSQDRLADAAAAITGEVRRTPGVTRAVLGVGEPSASLLDAVHDLRNAEHIASAALSLRRDPDRPYYRAGDVRLRGLLALIHNQPRVQRFAETELAALLRHDARHHDNLTAVLRAFLDLGGNKTELARRLNLSRPTLYKRLAQIERVAGVDLDDGESRTSLHTALLIRDF